MKKIKICLVSDTVYDVNGVSRFIQDFSKEALVLKKDFCVITSTKKTHYEKISNIKNIKPLFTMKMPFYKSLDLVLPNFFKIKNEIKKLNPDLLHISTPGTVGLCALISAKILKIPVVGIYHTDFPAYMYKNTKSKFVKKGTILFLKLFYKSYKAIFSRSEEYFKTIEEQLSFKKEDLYTLKAGIDIKNFDKKFKDDSIWEKYDIKQEKFKFLYTGRISVEKNVDILLKVWMENFFKECELILVGDKEIEFLDKDELKKSNITLVGRKQELELSQLYASSDCFIFPSTTDTLGQVVMEAMASGLPVIITNEGGPKTFVKDDCGYIIDLNNETQLSEAILKMSKKDEVYYSKKEKAYSFMRDKSISHSFLDFWNKNQEILEKLKVRN